MTTTQKFITRNIWILSLVSLFTDVAGEMLYPVMPLYLKSIGFSIVFIGVLEGLAEATAGLSKGYFGNWSDNIGRRLPFVQIGYGLSTLAKPLMAIFVMPIWVFFIRTLDRLGKGIRTGARDALLSDETTPEFKGRVFGFHRGMDTFGAVLGPALALIYLYFYPQQYRSLFLWAFIPGIIALGFTFLIKEKKKVVTPKAKPGLLDFVKYWQKSPTKYRQLVGALLVFTLFNSSDIFLILKIKESGMNDSLAIGIYIFYCKTVILFHIINSLRTMWIKEIKMFSRSRSYSNIVLINSCSFQQYIYTIVFKTFGPFAFFFPIMLFFPCAFISCLFFFRFCFYFF